MSGSRLIAGADYIDGFKPVTRSRREWQELMTAALKDGGHRRVEDGETFIHGRDWIMRHEIYENIPEAQQGTKS